MYHLSYEPIKKLSNAKQCGGTTFKPIGFWYAKGRAWIKFVEKEMPERKCCYLYKVIIDPKLKILKINTLKKYLDFVKQYPGYGPFKEDRTNEEYKKILPNWNDICKQYDGFEIIIPNFKKLKTEYFGMSIFDIPSGCIWRPGKTKLILIKKLS
jgi:hypothetical protein